MNTITRVYPIRTTKKEWTIPMYQKHICGLHCSKIYSRDVGNNNTGDSIVDVLSILRYVLIDNPTYINGKCDKTGKVENGQIQLSSFNCNRPFGVTGALYEPNTIVIPDCDISVVLTYPFTARVKVSIISKNLGGFTLAELINSIKIIYEYIYTEEERTSTPRLYHIKKDCTACQDKKDYVTAVGVGVKTECSICYNTQTDLDIGQLRCKHIYHKKCILKWLETSKTCPLCRQNVGKCDVCNGSEFIYYDYNGVVIPVEHRGSILNRNLTDGIFGIFGHDLEDLIIKNIHYNREKKILRLIIGS